MTVYKIYRAQHKVSEAMVHWLLKFKGGRVDCAVFDAKVAPSRIHNYVNDLPEKIDWHGNSDPWDKEAATFDAEMVLRWEEEK